MTLILTSVAVVKNRKSVRNILAESPCILKEVRSVDMSIFWSGHNKRLLFPTESLTSTNSVTGRVATYDRTDWIGSQAMASERTLQKFYFLTLSQDAGAGYAIFAAFVLGSIRARRIAVAASSYPLNLSILMMFARKVVMEVKPWEKTVQSSLRASPFSWNENKMSLWLLLFRKRWAPIECNI